MKKFIITILVIIVIALGVALGYMFYSEMQTKEDTNNIKNSVTVNVTPIEKEVLDQNVDKYAFVNKYKSIIQSYMPNLENKIYGLYAIKDINRDGVPELIIKDGVAEATTKLYIYTYKDNDAVLLGKVSAGNSVLYSSDEDYIILLTGHMGYESIYNISVDGSALKVDTIESDKDVSNGEYTQYDNELEMTNYGNTTTIDNYVMD